MVPVALPGLIFARLGRSASLNFRPVGELAVFSRRFAARHPCRVFTRLPASESLLFAWPKRSNQEKGHPDAAVSGHPALRLRNATLGVRRQSIHGLTSNWAQSIAPTLRAFPTSRCRCIGAPLNAHRARQSEQQSQRQSESRSKAEAGLGSNRLGSFHSFPRKPGEGARQGG